jgi:DNA repair exonuclease SbcCD ATPase subunit
MTESRELDHIQTELNILHERSQDNKLKIASHEASCDERYANIMKMLENSQKQHDEMHQEIKRLHNLATQGQSTIKTLFYVGTFTGALSAFIYTILQIFPK